MNSIARRCRDPLLAVLCCGLVAIAAAAPPPRPSPTATSVLGMPDGDWPFVHVGPDGPKTYLIPSQLDAVRQLGEPERSKALSFIREHQANLTALRQTSARFFPFVAQGGARALPEYDNDLAEAVMAVDPELGDQANPIHAHEPVLLALPSYSRVVLLTPAKARWRVRERLRALGLDRRVRIVLSTRPASTGEDGRTRWVRDTVFTARKAQQTVIYTSLAHKDFFDVAHHDLGYLGRLNDNRHQLVRAPIFFRGGNLAIAETTQRILLVGSDELEMNRQWFVSAFGFSPLPETVPTALQLAAQVDRVVVLPNSRNFYHLDMFLAPLARGKVALLQPQDPEHLAAADRQVLQRSREVLTRLGLQIVAVPTRSEWIAKFQSPTNVVSFVDHVSHRQRVLVPQFPEPSGPGAGASLNALALAAYRAAGSEPTAVEDRFHDHYGNTHCALVALH